MSCGRGDEHTIVETIEHVEEHGSHVTTRRPILLERSLGRRLCSGELFLKRIPSTPDHHRQDKQGTPGRLGPRRPPNTLDIQSISKNIGSDNLTGIVENTVEGSGPDVEFCRVEVVELVGVEPIAGEEHGKEKHDPGVGPEHLQKTKDLALPRRMFHQNHVGPIATDDIARIDQRPCQTSANECEDHEADVGTVGHAACRRVNVFTERNSAMTQSGGKLSENDGRECVYLQASNNSTQIEDHPKPGYVASL